MPSPPALQVHILGQQDGQFDPSKSGKSTTVGPAPTQTGVSAYISGVAFFEILFYRAAATFTC
jgi:hypothetical protein